MPRRRDIPAPNRRISTETAHATFAELQRSGALDVILNVMRDRADAIYESIRQALTWNVVYKPEQLAKFQFDQGGLRELQLLIGVFTALATTSGPAARIDVLDEEMP